MSIIFYEYEYCKELLEKGVERIRQNDLNYLAKYWDYEGFGPAQIRRNLEQFCLKNDRYFNVVQSTKMLKRAVAYSKRFFLRIPTSITITQAEIDRIRSLKDYKKEKLLFIMLVCARFSKKHPYKKNPKNTKYDDFLFSNYSIKDLQELAGIKYTRKEWNAVKLDLTRELLISPTLLGSKCWTIEFDNELSEPCLVIEDYRNPIAYYQQYCGEIMINCCECGVLISKKGKNHRMCNTCWGNSRSKKRSIYNQKYYFSKNTFEK